MFLFFIGVIEWLKTWRRGGVLVKRGSMGSGQWGEGSRKVLRVDKCRGDAIVGEEA